MEVAVGLGFSGVGEGLWDLRKRKRIKQRLGVASWHFWESNRDGCS